MKKVIYFILIGIILSCDNSRSNSDVQLGLNNLSCRNETELLTTSQANWKIPIERIDNIDNYIYESQIQLKSPNAINGIEETEYGLSIYSDIYPYIKVDEIEIGLMPLIRNTGSGHSSFPEDSYLVTIDTEFNTRQNLNQKIFKFFRNYQPKPEFNSSLRLSYPRVDLTFIGDSFYKINDALTEISLGYLKAAELSSEKMFSKRICELNKTQLAALKSEFKLYIRIFKEG